MSDAPTRCASCGIEIAPGLLACPACRWLVNGDRLKTLAAEAEIAEREGRVVDALTRWREARDLLPAGSRQHTAVGETVGRLSRAVDRAGITPPQEGGAGKAAGLGAVALIAWKLKFVLFSILGKAKLLVTGLASLPTLLTMFAWLAVDRSRGAAFAVGLVISIYIHEMGHVAALRRYGIQATAPMFVPGLGALVRLKQYPIDAREDANVGLAGPIWGCAAALFAIGPGLLFHDRTLLAVASLGASINVFNLIPVWQLDGARGFRALDARQRTIVLALAAIVGIVFDQVLGFAIAVAGGLRHKRDLPETGDPRAFRSFAGLLVLLSLIAWAGASRG